MSADVNEVLIFPGEKSNLLARDNSEITASQTPDSIFPLSRLYDDRPSQRFVFPANQEDDWIQADISGFENGHFNDWLGGDPVGYTVVENGTGAVSEVTGGSAFLGSALGLANGASGDAAVNQTAEFLAGETIRITVYANTTDAGQPNSIEIYCETTGKYLTPAGGWDTRRQSVFTPNSTSWQLQTKTITLEDFETTGRHILKIRARFHMDDVTGNNITHRYDEFHMVPAVTVASVHSYNIDPKIATLLTFGDEDIGNAPVDHGVFVSGTGEYFQLAGNLQSLASTDKFTFSIWLRFDGKDGQFRSVFPGAVGRFSVWFNTTNELRIYAENSAHAVLMDRSSTTTFTASSSWRHILVSVDLSGPTMDVYIDDTLETMTGTLSSGTIDFGNETGWTILASSAGSNGFNGVVGPFWFYGGVYFDLSVGENRRKFINSMGNWVDAGPEGKHPLGSSPHIWMRGGTAADFANNLGSGGNFTTNGTPDTVYDSITFDVEHKDPTFYHRFDSDQHWRYWRLKGQGVNTTDSGSITVGQWAIGDPQALLRNPRQRDFETLTELPQQVLESTVGDRWVQRKAIAKQRAFRMLFNNLVAHQEKLVEVIYERTNFGANSIIMVPDTNKSVVIHGAPVFNQHKVKRRAADLVQTELRVTENPHGIVTE